MLIRPKTLPDLLEGKAVDEADFEKSSLEAWAGKKNNSPIFLKELALEESYRALLKELAPHLKQHQVHPLVLGGVSFWDDFYEPGTRRVFDLDIWIPVKEEEACHQALSQAGFTQHALYKSIWYRHALEIDLHTHPINSERGFAFDHLFKFDAKEIYDRGEPLPVCPEEPWRRPKGDDLWIQHALHAIKHEFERLNLVLDLHFILLKHEPQSELAKKCWAAVRPMHEKLNLGTPLSPEKAKKLSHSIMKADGQRAFLNGLRLLASMGQSPFKFWLALAKGNKKINRETGGFITRYKRIFKKEG